MIRLWKTAIFSAVLLVLGGCAASGSSSSSAAVMMPNPMKSYESIGEMVQAVEFDFMVPTVLPDGYELDACCTISGMSLTENGASDIVSITYMDSEQNKALYRTTVSCKEYEEIGISGVYSSFAYRVTEQVGDYEVMFDCDGEDAPCLAQWSSGDMLYSLSGFTQEQAESCILSLAEAEK